MNPLLQQFIAEARDFLQGIAEKLMQLEKAPQDADLMSELFRFVHTLKGNSGLFEFPEMTRVLHAGEDLLDDVRNGRVSYSPDLADKLLDAMDFVGMLIDEIEIGGVISARFVGDSVRLTDSLRILIAASSPHEEDLAEAVAASRVSTESQSNLVIGVKPPPVALADIPESLRMEAYRLAHNGQPLHWLVYAPAEDCFFQGEDPFFQARQTPDLLWGGIVARVPWPKLAEMDAYRCLLDFQLLSSAPADTLADYYRYMADHINHEPLSASALIAPNGDPNGGSVYEDFISDAWALLQANDLVGLTRIAETLLALSGPDLWIASALRWLLLVLELEPDNHQVLNGLLASMLSLSPCDRSALQSRPQPTLSDDQSGNENPSVAAPSAELQTRQAVEHDEALRLLVATQREILQLPITEPWQLGRMQAAAATLVGCLRTSDFNYPLADLLSATEEAMKQGQALPLLHWLDQYAFQQNAEVADNFTVISAGVGGEDALEKPKTALQDVSSQTKVMARREDQLPDAIILPTDSDAEFKFGRRAEDHVAGAKSVKVDQAKIDRLMNLIGEMVVSKNALPYLAGRAETVFGTRELSREIKAQYAVINRIAEEMQDAIMQVRMMPVSFVFQRFSRLVRDTSRKLGKDVKLVLEGEDTEADKNIIESLGDPLVHIIRNSLDHGFELPEVRQAAGKPVTGTLIIRASQESDRVIIEIIDDGKGIDPALVKRKAYEKGLLDEAGLERISDQEAINLIFAAGFSTAEVVTDLSGRGVGMDVVRTAIEKVNGAISLESEKGKGTRIRLSLPLSIAVTNVMIIESDGQLFGVPMDSVVETVRIPRRDLRSIKQSLATVLRGRIVPIKAINSLLAIAAEPKANADDELAVLVVRLGEEAIGLLVDDFRETVDIILKPMTGVLTAMSTFAGSALMGDGSVLLVLNVKELLL